MSDTAPTPEAAAPAAPEAPTGISPEARAAKARDAARNIFARAAPAAAPSADDAPAPAAPASAAPAVDHDRLAAIVRETAAAERKAYETEQELKALRAEREREKAEHAKRLESDPVFRRMAEGGTYEDVTRDIVEGKFAPLTEEQKALRATTERQSALEAELKALRDEREAEKRAAATEQRKSAASESLKASAERYPLAASFPWAAEKAVSLAGDEGDVDAAFAQLEQAVLGDIDHVFGSDAAIKHLLADPGRKGRVLKALGLDAQPKTPAATAPQPDQRDTPRSATRTVPRSITHSTANEPVARSTRALSPEERRENAAKAVRAVREARG